MKALIDSTEAAEIMGISRNLLIKRLKTFPEHPKPSKVINNKFFFVREEIENYEHVHKRVVNPSEQAKKRRKHTPWGIDNQRFEFLKRPSVNKEVL